MQNITSNITEMEDLAQELVDFASSPESRNFYLKAINVLGSALVREAMGEIRYKVNIGETRDKARHLTWTLQNWMSERGLLSDVTDRGLMQNTRGCIQTPPPPLMSFDDLKTPISPETKNSEPLPIPFGRDVLPWVLCVNNDYFTLTNEKADSDQVKTDIAVNGKTYSVTMLRGKKGRHDSPRGIPTTEHMRVLMATVRLWATAHSKPKDDAGNPVTVLEKGGVRICCLDSNIPEIAAEMGLGKLGGDDYKRIEKKIQDLSSSGYTFLLRDIPELKAMGLDDNSFQFYGEVDTLGMTVNGRRVAKVKIFFSSRYSEYLLKRQVVTRPMWQIRLRGDIALKLCLYLYPILVKRKDGDEFPIELERLIQRLGLKRTGWHMHKSQRKRVFETAIRELNGQPTTDGRIFNLRIETGLNPRDYVLIARFTQRGEKKEIIGGTVNGSINH